MVDKLYNLQEVAEALRVSTRTIYTYLYTGQLKAIKLGNKWRIAEADLNAFIANKRANTAELYAQKGANKHEEV